MNSCFINFVLHIINQICYEKIFSGNFCHSFYDDGFPKHPGRVCAGKIPAKVVRERKTEGRHGKELDQIWLYNGAFQDE